MNTLKFVLMPGNKVGASELPEITLSLTVVSLIAHSTMALFIVIDEIFPIVPVTIKPLSLKVVLIFET